LFHADRRTNGRTDTHDEANICLSQFLRTRLKSYTHSVGRT